MLCFWCKTLEISQKLTYEKIYNSIFYRETYVIDLITYMWNRKPRFKNTYALKHTQNNK